MPGFSATERLAVYAHLRTFESDFDKSQSQIRAICSAWSAAVLGAVALIAIGMFTPPSNFDIKKEILRADHLAFIRNLVCVIGSAGVATFWFVDQRIYQRLLHSVFAYGLFLEQTHPELPQIRSSLYVANLDITNGLASFYRLQMWMFLAVAALFVLPLGIDLGPKPNGVRELAVLHFVAVVVVEAGSQRWASLRTVVSRLYPQLADTMPQKQTWTERMLERMLEWVGFYPNVHVSTAENHRREETWLRQIRKPPLP